MLKKLLHKIRLRRLWSIPPGKLDTLNIDFSPLDETSRKQIDLVVIAFNQPELIAQQIRLLRKNFAPAYTYTVADNFTDANASDEIRSLCTENKIPYIRLPRNPYKKDGSRSHAWSLNFILHKYIRPRAAEFFGFLDHDIFPVKPFDPQVFLQQQSFYGLYQDREERWYLWPGLCFFCGNDAPDDFMPIPGLDSGGAGWEKYYSRFDRENLLFNPHEGSHIIRTAQDMEISVDVFDCWLHLRDGSNWRAQQDHAEQLVAKIEYLKSF